MNLEVERMGQGHALSVTLSWKLQPGELSRLRTEPTFADELVQQLAYDAQRTIAQKLPHKLKKVKA